MLDESVDADIEYEYSTYSQASDTAPCEGLSILPMDVHAVGVFFISIPEKWKRDLRFGLDFYTRGVDFAKKNHVDLIFSCTWCYATGSLEGGVGLGGVGWGWYYTCLLLRHLIFSCTWCYATWSCTWCYATGSSLLRHLIFSCAWCYAAGSSLLRHLIFYCTWCYATWSSLALDATPLDLLCYATWSSLALDAEEKKADMTDVDITFPWSNLLALLTLILEFFCVSRIEV